MEVCALLSQSECPLFDVNLEMCPATVDLLVYCKPSNQTHKSLDLRSWWALRLGPRPYLWSWACRIIAMPLETRIVYVDSDKLCGLSTDWLAGDDAEQLMDQRHEQQLTAKAENVTRANIQRLWSYDLTALYKSVYYYYYYYTSNVIQTCQLHRVPSKAVSLF